MTTPKKPDPPAHDHDRFHPIATAPNGDMLAHRCNHGVSEVVQLRRAKEGQPFLGEPIALRKSAEQPGAFEGETISTGRTPAGHGPAKVATAAYREGWSAIFEKPDRSLN